MAKRSVIPFGPQHPVLPEPIHLDLELEDETIVKAMPNFGFVHRGLESLCTKRDFQDYVYVVERTCGICSFMHGMGYCEAIERLMKIEIPRRADYLRTIWAELSRIHSHMLWLGLVADAMGFENLYNHAWRLREDILDIFQMTTGGRVIFSVCNVGGVKRDMDTSQLRFIADQMTALEQAVRVMAPSFLNDKTVATRLTGLGVMDKQTAIDYGTVGPFMRASGVRWDLRQTGYSAYGDLDFEPIVRTDGDCYARVDQRIAEIYQSCDLVRQAIALIPPGEIKVPVKGNPKGEYMMRLEQPRGEAIYYVMGNNTKNLARMRIRTPTITNFPAIANTLVGTQMADVMLVIITIDPCISCVER